MESNILQQISKLPAKEKRQIRAAINHDLGTLYAAQQRRKKIVSAKTQIEQGLEKEM